MSYLSKCLGSRAGASDIRILNSTANASLGSTKDGINIGGHRLALDIIDCIKKNPDLSKVR